MKKLFLIRGVSGSGKTTFVESVMHEGDVSVANDDFMVDEKGEYAFDWKRLDEVAEKCQQKVERSMEQEVPRIFVHNTFSTVEELDPYYSLAREYGYDVQSIVVENRGNWQSSHGVPDTTLEKQQSRFDIKLR